MSPRPARRPRGAVRAPSAGRLRIALLLVTAIVSVFGGRLLQLQGVDPKAYAARAQADGVENVVLPAKRGAILDRNGQALAKSIDGLMLIGDPKLTTDRAPAIARVLATRLGVDYFDTLAKLQKKGSRFVYLARRVPSTLATETVERLEGRGLEGVSTEADPVRSYPAKDVAANVLGFLGSREDADQERPLAGLELAFNQRLSGTDGSETFEVGSNGARIPLGDNSVVPPRNGESLTLTIDREVNWYIQRVLRNAVQDARGESGAAIAVNSRTGEVLGLADYPTFDANQPGRSPKEDRGSRAVSDVYEPGSVEKVLTASALLDAGKVTPLTRISVPPELPVLDRVVHDWFDHGRIPLTMTGVIARSSNIGTVLASQQLSSQQLHDYLTEFGLGRRTGVGVPGETRGLVRPAESWSKVDHATVAFGQGISVNTLQMAAAINTIANGGELVTPSLVRGTATTDAGEEVGTGTSRRERVVSPKAAEQMTRMMEMVVDEEVGTAPVARVPGYRVAGKTGTAQRVGKTCGCYDGTYTVSFAGFAPADDPRFTVYVVVQNPRNGGRGGSVGGPAFAKIMGYLLSRYGVPPTGAESPHLPINW